MVLVAHKVTLQVLPFESAQGDTDARAFVRGFATDLIAEFSRFSELAVFGNEPKRDEAGRANAADIEGAADREGAPDPRPRVDYVLRGVFRRDDAAFRVSVELLEGSSGVVIWADKLDGVAARIVHLQDEICGRVVGVVSDRLRATLTAAARRKSTRERGAYDAWLRGLDELRAGTVEADERARRCFEAALENDPAYARAYVGLSLSHFNEWSCQLWERWDENEQAAYTYAERALELDHADHWCQLVIGRILLFRREFVRAEEHLLRALALNGNDPDALVQLAMALAFLDRRDVSEELFRRALDRNPYHSQVYYAYGLQGAFAGERYRQVIDYARRVPPNVMVDCSAYAAAAFHLLGEPSAARAEVDAFLEQFESKIARGRTTEPGEALRWLQHTNPFRCKEVDERLVGAVRGACGAPSEAPRAVAEVSDLCVFRPVGSLWQATFGGTSVWLPPCKGFSDIRLLLAASGTEVHCNELMGVVGSASDAEVMDQRARDAYVARIRVLQRHAASEPAASKGAVAELASLTSQLEAGVGLGGRMRKLAAPSERARSAVTQRIKAALQRIQSQHPALGEHFARHLHTGTFCIYSPPSPLDWRL